MEVLKPILHEINIDQLVEDFKQQYEVTNEAPEDKNHPEEIKRKKIVILIHSVQNYLRRKSDFFLSDYSCSPKYRRSCAVSS